MRGSFSQSSSSKATSRKTLAAPRHRHLLRRGLLYFGSSSSVSRLPSREPPAVDAQANSRPHRHVLYVEPSATFSRSFASARVVFVVVRSRLMSSLTFHQSLPIKWTACKLYLSYMHALAVKPLPRTKLPPPATFFKTRVALLRQPCSCESPV